MLGEDLHALPHRTLARRRGLALQVRLLINGCLGELRVKKLRRVFTVQCCRETGRRTPPLTPLGMR